MILYVETNFVLELAFEQEEHGSCRALLDLAKARPDGEELELVLPAFCVGEAYGRQIRRQRGREALHRRLLAELGELSRSAYHAGPSERIREATGLLVESAEEERGRLEGVLGELYDAATLVPHDEAVARDAHSQQARRGLEPQDATVYASVLAHLRSMPAAAGPAPGELAHCFVTRDRDFANADVGAELEALGARSCSGSTPLSGTCRTASWRRRPQR